jgi:hypothetical protein
VVLVKNAVGYHMKGYTHVLGACHDSVEVEIRDVNGAVACVGGGDGAVEVTFDSGHVNGGSTGGADVVGAVMSNSKTDPMHFRFERFEGSDNANVSDGATSGNMLETDSLDGFGAVRSQAGEFVDPTLFPVFALGSFEEVAVL